MMVILKRARIGDYLVKAIMPFTVFCLLNVSTFTLGQTCAGRFVEHLLPHTTRPRGEIVRFYESNGSGVGINDLNNDGLLDIVLGNLDGANSILWNEGDMQFRHEPFMPTGRTRAVNLVDVDADGWLDIVVTTQTGTPYHLRNNGDETFTFTPLNGVTHYAYTMQWGDVDLDGDLDLVTASYDAELSALLGNSFLFNGGGGVYYYENQDGTFHANRLSDEAQALAIWLSDLNRNGTTELFIGNDFSMPDRSWSFIDGTWQENTLFTHTSFSTMSFDVGDLNNDGNFEFFSADMYPYDHSEEALRPWERVLSDLESQPLLPDDIQLIQNTLLMQDGMHYDERASEYAIAASGWSWSGKFGDLDHDGFIDLYVVNGMIAQELFANLPDDELVEANQVFHNQKGAGFIPAPSWGLDSRSSGRGMSLGDLDNDGDLDIVINNLNAPAQLFENDLCSGRSLQVDLRAPGTQNTYGIGATLILETTAGTLMRDVRTGSGYLSGDPTRVHFGLPDESHPIRLSIYWTDGDVTQTDTFTTITTVTR